MKLLLILLLALYLTQSLTAFGSHDEENQKTKKPSDYKIILILPGPINDQSWNATNYNGLIASNKSLGTKIEYIENVRSGDFESTFRNYAEEGYDLIMAAGTQFDEAANNVAVYYPDTTFCVVNGMLSKFKNVTPIFPKEYEASYLAAIIASHITENGKIATVGGFPNRAMIDLLDVYEQTVSTFAQKNRDLEIIAYREYSNSWDDISLGKRMADEMIDKGADVLFFYANQVGLGAIQSARERGVKFIGFSSNQNSIAPETVVASIGFDFASFYIWAISLYLDGKLEGKVNLAGIKEGIFIPYYSVHINKEIQNDVEQAYQNVIDGNVDFDSMLSRSF
ncbi:MAG: BMP family protein [Spirochaetaceae bacterium]|nr:BMP family protein [Spirochaetaceae bacterium]